MCMTVYPLCSPQIVTGPHPFPIPPPPNTLNLPLLDLKPVFGELLPNMQAAGATTNMHKSGPKCQLDQQSQAALHLAHQEERQKQ